MKISIQICASLRKLCAPLLLLAALAPASGAPHSSSPLAAASELQPAGVRNSLSTLLAAASKLQPSQAQAQAQAQAHAQAQAQAQAPAVQVSPAPSSAARPEGGAASAEKRQQWLEGGAAPSNLFADDSLWQIPIHLVRDAADAPDAMAKSASELSAADERDESDDSLDLDEQQPREAASLLAQQKSADAAVSGSAPSIISASTSASSGATQTQSQTQDLKTAAGYHHATPHHQHGHDHYAGYEHEAPSHHHHEPAYANHHDHGHYGKYFQYASVPYPYAWDFGYRRGNPYHTIERYEHGKGPHFQTKVKWSDKHAGYGVHVWDYNHDDHHAHHYDSHAPQHYDSHGSGAQAAHYGAH